VLRLVAAGYTNRQIGLRLRISEGTVRTHLEHIFERLEVPSGAAAVARAFPDGLDRSSRNGNAGNGPPSSVDRS
jgi:DNA-binding NarL/FixJ family response regulator